jgi:hypothetical protein
VVYTWYNDSSLSRGTVDNLGEIEPALNSNGDINKQVSLPQGYGMSHVIDMAIAKSNNHVYTWYNDGTVTSGTSTDLDAYRPTYTFKTPAQSGFTPLNIRAFGISQNDSVYSWFITNYRSKGTTDSVADELASYSFPNVPNAPNYEDWYGDITLQHLFDHKAGFLRNGDVAGAARALRVSESSLTYTQAHRYTEPRRVCRRLVGLSPMWRSARAPERCRRRLRPRPAGRSRGAPAAGGG